MTADGVMARLGQIKPRGRAPGRTHPCPPARAASQPTHPVAGHRPPPAPTPRPPPAPSPAALGHSDGPRPRSTRAGRATNLGTSRPPVPKATQLSRLSNEAAYRLHESRGQGPGVLEAFVENVKKSCRKLAQKLSCMDTPYEEPPLPAQSGGTSSASLRTPAGSSQLVTGVTSTVRTPPHYSAGKDPAIEDDEDEDDDDEWEDWVRAIRTDDATAPTLATLPM
ncbi:uncharacterized protein [Miscanthus floridulus]|uniref:uncharacterized protein n=1 Tax=Miscanthus floridulus TaxID=154761 RepID=UPI00345AC2AD